MKQKCALDQRDDEISDLRLKLSDSKEASDKYRVERDSLRKEVEKLYDQLRALKEESAHRFETYNKQINQSESLSEEKVRSVHNENERLKDENENLRKGSAQLQALMHE